MFDWLTNLFGTTEEAWNDAVQRFMDTAAQLDRSEQQHLEIRGMAEMMGDLANWDAYQDRILYTRQAVTDISDSLRSGSQWFRQTFGMSALSFVPIVPLAVITGSISAMVALIYAVSSYNQNVRAKWDFIQSRPDLTPAQVQDVLESSPVGTGIGGAFSDATKLATWIVIGGVLLLVAAKLPEGRK